jgi:hypothetical protein
MRRPDLLLLIAIWQFIIAFLCLITIAAIAIVIFPGNVGYYGPVHIGTVAALSIIIFLLLGCIGLSVAGGVGILLGKNWGRIVSIVNAVINLFSIPVGTIIGVLVLIYLNGSELRGYFERKN